MSPSLNLRNAVCLLAGCMMLSTGAIGAGDPPLVTSGPEGAAHRPLGLTQWLAWRAHSPKPDAFAEWGERARGPGGVGSGAVNAAAGSGASLIATWRSQIGAHRARFFLDDGGLADIELFDIAPSADPSALFRAAGRFFIDAFVQTRDAPQSLAGIRRFGAALGWDRPFLLINLFRRNGIDAELVLYSLQDRFDPEDLLSFDRLDVAAVYVPAADRYYDPLDLAPTQADFDRGLREIPRLHIAALSLRSLDSAKVCAGACIRLPDKPRPVCRDRCAEPAQEIVQRRVKVLGISTPGHPVRPIEDAAPGRFVKDRAWMPVP
jgi:hypothetical protein